jgi:cytoskeletal protein RodZ
MRQQMTQELENRKIELETEAERLRSEVLEKNRKRRTRLVYLLILVVVVAGVVGAISGLGNKTDNAETNDEACPYDTTPIGNPNSGTQYI